MTDARSIKAGFVSAYSGSAHLREALPHRYPGAPAGRLEKMHMFARACPFYHGSSEMDLGEPCTAYEGDISGHWIDSTKHDASAQPFYPTWILSAYLAAAEAARLGARQAVDVGSGDGRMAYACALAGMESHGVELDPGLCALQKSVSESTGVGFGVHCADAASFDYSALGLRRPAVFIGGLPQMGEGLAEAVVESVLGLGPDRPVFVLMGSLERRALGPGGSWDRLLEKAGLAAGSVLELPTSWTMDRDRDTQYIYAS